MNPTPIPNNLKVVTFDFDQTLSNRLQVQEYAKELIEKDYQVWVVTARYDDLHQYRYTDTTWNNLDLWEVIDRIGLPRWKVRFMNFDPKYLYLAGSRAIWHLDDDEIELEYIKDNIKTVGIQVNSLTWKQECEKLLK